MATERTASNTPADNAKNEQRRQAAQESLEATQQASVVLEQVMRCIDEPPNFLQLKIRPLWKHHFRANLYVGIDGVDARICNSYFIVTDDAGIIQRATPPLLPIRRDTSKGVVTHSSPATPN